MRVTSEGLSPSFFVASAPSGNSDNRGPRYLVKIDGEIWMRPEVKEMLEDNNYYGVRQTETMADRKLQKPTTVLDALHDSFRRRDYTTPQFNNLAKNVYKVVEELVKENPTLKSVLAQQAMESLYMLHTSFGGDEGNLQENNMVGFDQVIDWLTLIKNKKLDPAKNQVQKMEIF